MTFKQKTPRPKKCPECGIKFKPTRQIQPVCEEFACKVAYAERVAEKSSKKRAQDADRAARQKQTQEDREHRKKLESTKKLSWFLNRAQRVFNAYIRFRDRHQTCICCGGSLDWSDPLQVNAGHWRTVAAAGHLRFNEDNVHAQRAYCNLNLAGNQAAMEQGMIVRIGLERVEALKNDNSIHNWTREELTAIWELYKQKLKDLKAIKT